MLSFFLWIVTDLENTSPGAENDQQSEKWGRLSVALHILLPVAGLMLLLNQKYFFYRLLLQLDRNCVAVFCPSFSKREKLLKWAGGRLPATWSSQSKTLSGGIAELWTDGSLLCTLINSAIPGACPNPHRHWKKPPLHAQAIAYKYLGVIPIFTESDLSGDFLIQERNFLHYLNELQEAITKLSDRHEIFRCMSTQYLPRGMGLYTGEQHRKTVFYVYPNMISPTYHSSNVIVHIRGPYGTYGKAVIPKFHDFFINPEINVISDAADSSAFKENSFVKSFSLPFMQYHKKHNGDNIVIDVTIEGNRAQVTYIPKNYGMYEIILISNGELVRGCPFNVHILNNTSGIEENVETDQQKDEILHIKQRKVISKTIDFVNEQIPMTEVVKKYRYHEEVNKIDSKVATKIFTFGAVVDKLLNSRLTEAGNITPDMEHISQDLSEHAETDDDVDGKVATRNSSNISEEEKQTPESTNEGQEDIKSETKLDQIQEIDFKPKDDYSRKFNVSKIEIPENFCQQDTSRRNFIGLDQKYFKNVINSSNKKDLPTFQTQKSLDGHRNMEEMISSLNEISNHIDSLEYNELRQNLALSRRNSKIDIEKIKAVPIRFFHAPKENSKYPSSSLIDQITSPICADHIVPEVNSAFSKMPVAERRKIFAKQCVRKSSSSSNSSSSDTEKTESLKDHRGLKGLHVLNYLGSLKDSDVSKTSINHSLSSTISLPNISTTESELRFRNSVRARKNFWENLSNSTSLSTIDASTKRREILTESERCKLIWKKPDEREERVEENLRPKKKSEMYKSVDAVFPIKNLLNRQNSKKYKSLDDYLDNCGVLSIDDRKKMLLKHNYEKERLHKEKAKPLENNSIQRRHEINVKRQTENNNNGIVVPPLSEKIREYGSACNLANLKEETTNNNNANKNATNDLSKDYIHNDVHDLSPPQKVNVKSQFKRVFKYFKNLEEKSLERTDLKPKRKTHRRYSFDIQLKKNQRSKKGGSLNLPKVSERFSISNLYDEVFGSRRGSFKGAVNRSAVVEALATFSRGENDSFTEDNEDDIRYNIFKRKARTKSRRSVKSIFDVYY